MKTSFAATALVLSSVCSQAAIIGLPAELKSEESRILASVNREAGVSFAGANKNCQSVDSELNFKRRINDDLLLFDVRLEWTDKACGAKLPKNCQSIFSLKQGLVDLSCGEGDENWE